MEWRQPVDGPGYFPLCPGMLDADTDLSKTDTLILGQDFGKLAYCEPVLTCNSATSGSGETLLNSATLRGLKRLLEHIGLPLRNCLFRAC